MIVGRVSLATVACTGPLLCAIHCLAAPLLVIFAPALAPTPATEWLLLAASTVICGPVLLLGHTVHRRFAALVPGAFGILIWTLSLLGTLMPVAEEITTTMGSILLAGSLFLDRRWRREAGCGGVARHRLVAEGASPRPTCTYQCGESKVPVPFARRCISAAGVARPLS